MTSSTSPDSRPLWRRRRTLVAAAVAVVVLAATGIAVWQVGSGSSGEEAATSTGASTTPVGIAAEIVSPAELRAVAQRLGRPVYWAGTRPGAKIEFTESSDGSTFVRYLTGSAAAGDKRSAFVVVATYAQANAYDRVRSIARRKHFHVEQLADGAVAVTEPSTPRNVHLAFRSRPYQVEVYAPQAAAARRIARSGAVEPVG
jgi:hypothetical protein